LGDEFSCLIEKLKLVSIGYSSGFNIINYWVRGWRQIHLPHQRY